MSAIQVTYYSCLQTNTTIFGDQILETFGSESSKTIKMCRIKPNEDIPTCRFPYFEKFGLGTTIDILSLA